MFSNFEGQIQGHWYFIELHIYRKYNISVPDTPTSIHSFCDLCLISKRQLVLQMTLITIRLKVPHTGSVSQLKSLISPFFIQWPAVFVLWAILRAVHWKWLNMTRPPYMYCIYELRICIYSVLKSQIWSILFTGNLAASALKASKMTLNTTRSKLPDIYVTSVPDS